MEIILFNFIKYETRNVFFVYLHIVNFCKVIVKSTWLLDRSSLNGEPANKKLTQLSSNLGGRLHYPAALSRDMSNLGGLGFWSGCSVVSLLALPPSLLSSKVIFK